MDRTFVSKEENVQNASVNWIILPLSGELQQMYTVICFLKIFFPSVSMCKERNIIKLNSCSLGLHDKINPSVQTQQVST